jgi:subtilase family serine protease
VAHAPDLGAVEDAKPLNLFLLLQRSTAQQADLDSLIARQQEPGAPEYHKWLTPAEFGARFGASPQDITKLSTWLQSHGFKIRSVLNNASMIDFEATAGQVREAFHAQLHYVSVRGGKYPALRQDPQIPAALIPVVAGIEGLNKIPPQANHGAPRHASRDQATHRWHIVNPTPADTASPDYSDGSGDYLVGPQDLYTIYKINPVFTGGNLAATATVAVIEQSDIEYGTVNSTTGVATGGDVATFRSVFGVPGTLNMHVYHGYGSVTCNDPGITYADEFEASLDAEWINATAPSANLIFMSCDDDPDDGIFLLDDGADRQQSLRRDEPELWRQRTRLHLGELHVSGRSVSSRPPRRASPSSSARATEGQMSQTHTARPQSESM